MTTKSTKEGLRHVAIIAGGIWLEHGAKKTKWSRGAVVPYRTLERLKAALDAAGFDMDNARKRYEQSQRVVEEPEEEN
jgi:uncharacterized protein YbaA (DUF1428 family)